MSEQESVTLESPHSINAESIEQDKILDMDEPQEAEMDSDQSLDGETMGMFASVWVKVEVNELENANNDSESTNEISFVTKKRSKRKLRSHNKKLQTEQFDLTAAYKNCLERNNIQCDNGSNLSCECGYTTKYLNSLIRHNRIKHQTTTDLETSIPELKCKQCDYTTFSKANFKVHERKHSLPKKYECDYCNYKTPYKHNLDKHKKVHNENTAFKCDKCPFFTKHEGHIIRHLAKIHQEITENASKCSYCDFSTTIKWRLNVHMQRSKQNEPLKCNRCNFETVYMCESKKHKTVHFNEIYTKKNSLEETDMESTAFNTDEKQNEKCVDNTNFNAHNSNEICELDNSIEWRSINVLDTNNKDRPFQCEQCLYSSRFKASVQRHFQRHHTGNQHRPYKCENCDFTTKTKDQISLHNKRSKSESLLNCNACDFHTHFKCQLVCHQKIHNDYKCTMCDYSSRSKYDLQRHYSVTHEGSPLKCQYCEFTAKRKDSLICHETIHTGKKPYSCEFCSYTSVRKSLLLNHMKRYHSDVQSNVTVVSESKIQSLKLPVESIMQQFEDESIEIRNLSGNV